MPHPNGGRADPVSLILADEGAGRARDVRQCFQGLHHAQIVCRVHDGTGAMGNEIEQFDRRTLAVEFSEEAERAAANG